MSSDRDSKTEPSNAVNGDYGPQNVMNLNMAATNKEDPRPWLAIDLQSAHLVYFVRITNSGIQNLPDDERLGNFKINVGFHSADETNKEKKHLKNPICATYKKTMAPTSMRMFQCKGPKECPLVGKWVSVTLEKEGGTNRQFHLVEVDVYGERL